MSKKQFLALPVTGDTFAEIREKNRYYVDKTPYLKQVFSEDESVDENSLIDGTTVLLLTRPRRFGKTLLMTMFESFLKISSKNPGDTTIHQSYFNDTKIFEDKEFCKKYMGQFPVIAITLKDVLGDSYEDTYFQLAGIIADKVNEFGFLKDSPALNENDKDTFSKLSNKNFLVTSSAQSRYYITQAIA
ncbi:MAG: AAA family ATPase, partial [Succinivibrio sp.]|nr:AAA family ATPase [Succinivibrio sp.]